MEMVDSKQVNLPKEYKLWGCPLLQNLFWWKKTQGQPQWRRHRHRNDTSAANKIVKLQISISVMIGAY